jgi:hypothetical protein
LPEQSGFFSSSHPSLLLTSRVYSNLARATEGASLLTAKAIMIPLRMFSKKFWR